MLKNIVLSLIDSITIGMQTYATLMWFDLNSMSNGLKWLSGLSWITIIVLSFMIIPIRNRDSDYTGLSIIRLVFMIINTLGIFVLHKGF